MRHNALALTCAARSVMTGATARYPAHPNNSTFFFPLTDYAGRFVIAVVSSRYTPANTTTQIAISTAYPKTVSKSLVGSNCNRAKPIHVTRYANTATRKAFSLFDIARPHVESRTARPRGSLIASVPRSTALELHNPPRVQRAVSIIRHSTPLHPFRQKPSPARGHNDKLPFPGRLHSLPRQTKDEQSWYRQQ
jgi:hypothetical protein